MFGTGQERLSDWWIDKGAEWGMDPERLFAAYYNQGDFRLWEDIESRLQATGQPEPIEPKKCVNCQRPREIGCCEKFEYDRMVGLKLIEGVVVEPVQAQSDRVLDIADCAICVVNGDVNGGSPRHVLDPFDSESSLVSCLRRGANCCQMETKEDAIGQWNEKQAELTKFYANQMVGIPELGPPVFFGDISEEDRKAWYSKMHPCALCDSAEATWIDAQRLDPKCGCHECDSAKASVNHCSLVNDWNDYQEKVKANIAGETPEISENKLQQRVALTSPRSWPGVINYETSTDAYGLKYHIKGKGRKGHKVSIEGYRIKGLFEAWTVLSGSYGWKHIDQSRIHIIRRSKDGINSPYYGVTRVDVTGAPTLILPAF